MVLKINKWKNRWTLAVRIAIGYPYYKGSPCVTTEIITDKFDVLRGQLLGNHKWKSLWFPRSRPRRTSNLLVMISVVTQGKPLEVVMISLKSLRFRYERGSRYDFPGVDHERRQTCRLWFPWSHKGNPCSRDSLWLSLLQGFSDFFTCLF